MYRVSIYFWPERDGSMVSVRNCMNLIETSWLDTEAQNKPDYAEPHQSFRG